MFDRAARGPSAHHSTLATTDGPIHARAVRLLIVVCLVRDGEAVIPDGKTVLTTDDNVVILGNECDLPQVISRIRGESI